MTIYECKYCHSEIQNPKPNKSFCSNRCKSMNRKKPWGKFKKDHCEECGFVPQHKVQLDVDHIDGNKDNNHPSNLKTLCANCHRLKTHLNSEHLNLAYRA